LATASRTFIEALRHFADGTAPISAFENVIRAEIVNGPQVVLYDGAEPDVVFRPELEWAFYLDMVLDAGPHQDHAEARRLAGSLAALLASVDTSDEFLTDLMALARWKSKSVDRLRAYAGGSHDREAFERFVERRPWPAHLQARILALPPVDVTRLAAYLEADNWTAVRDLLGAA